MFGWFKKCEHDFQKIGEKISSYYDDYGKLVYWKRYRMYCPKCDREKLVDAERYDIEKTKRRIKEKYYGK